MHPVLLLLVMVIVDSCDLLTHIPVAPFTYSG